MNLGTLLILLAFLLAVLASLGISGGRIALGWAALALYFASLLLGGIHF